MRSRPAVVGGFILGALGLAVAAVLFFGTMRLFATNSRSVVFFNESLAGLETGSPVTFQGVRIGSVQSMAVHFSPGALEARIPVYLNIDPAKLVWNGTKPDGSAAEYERLVQAGLRAQLALQSFVTGQLRVDLDFRPGTPAQLVGAVAGIPEIPAVSSDLSQLRNQLSGLQLRQLADTAQQTLASLRRLSDRLDWTLDPLANSARRAADTATETLETTTGAVRRLQADASTTLHDLDSLLADAHQQLDTRGRELGQTLAAADRTARQAGMLLDSLNGLAAPNSLTRGDIESTLRDLAATARSLRGFAKTIERSPAALLVGR